VGIRVLRHAEGAHGTGTILVIMTVVEMIDGTDTGIAGVEDVHSLGVSALCVRIVSFCLICLSPYS
jgi:hypothetical protein